MALPINKLEEFIITLGTLVHQGILDDVMAFGSNCRSISITKTASIQEFYTYMQQINCDSIGIKLSRKLRYERPIYINKLADFKINRKSLIITLFDGQFTDNIRYKF